MGGTDDVNGYPLMDEEIITAPEPEPDESDDEEGQ